MVRFGLIGVNTSHADAFSRIFNGAGDDPGLIADGEIVAVWGGQPERVKELIERHHIGESVEQPTDMIGLVDAVLVVDDTDGGGTHATLARPFLEAGLPVFVDKPMTTDFADAVELFDIAEQHNAPLMSCSALRFSVELEAARAQFAAIGKIYSTVSVGPQDWFYYGVHAVEMLGSVVGTGAEWVQRHVFDTRDVVVVGYADGTSAVVETLRDAKYVFHLTAYGADGWASIEVKDSLGFYTNTMSEVVKMVQNGRSPLSREQTLEVLAILHAGNRSAETGQKVAIADIYGSSR